MRKMALFFVMAAGLFAASEASACSVQSTTPVAFGVYDPGLVGGVLTEGLLTIRCPGTRLTRVTLSPGQNPSGPWNRNLASGSSRLAYQLYLDPQRTQIFGDGTSGTHVYAPNPARPGNHQITIYAHMPAGQYVMTGSYSDTITVTMVY